jgi:CHAD domain-containing protein
LVAALDDDRFAELVRALRAKPPLERRAARRSTACLARRALKRGRRLPRKDYARLHALRRSVRRTRFALEWLGKPTQDLADVQDALGSFGDAWVAFRGICAQSAKQRRRLKRKLEKSAREARRAWKKARPSLEKLA